MKPEEVGYLTELDEEYAEELQKVDTADHFANFLLKWDYWLDEQTKTLEKYDWGWLKPLVDDCRNEKVIPEDRHKPALDILIPEKIMKISIIKNKFGAPWGCAYIRAKEEKLIDF